MGSSYIMGSKNTAGQRSAPNFTANWPNTIIITNLTIDELGTTSMHRNPLKTEPITSKYERILLSLSDTDNLNSSNGYKNDRRKDQKSHGEADRSDKLIPLILPLALMGIFLAIVIVCFRADTIRNRRRKRRCKSTGTKVQKGSEAEQGVEEVDHEVDMELLKERNNKMAHNFKKHGEITCSGIGHNGVGRCMCKLERCAHCLGFETKKLQWKDLVYQADIQRIKTFYLKNASTQTWMPMHSKFRALPQSSHKDSCISQRIPSVSRHYVVEADSVFDSEVSSKPHFPSSESNYTDSKKSDFLSSIRVSGSFYYSTTSAQDSKVSAEQYEDERSRRKQKHKGLNKQAVGDVQLLSEGWI